MPTLRLAISHSALTGITAQAESASAPVTRGASRNTPLLAPEGMIGSLNTNLKRSAKDWSSPQGPTTLGTLRICNCAILCVALLVLLDPSGDLGLLFL